MTDIPFKLRVLRALTDALKEITPANGYVNDLSDIQEDDDVTVLRVHRGRAWFGDDDVLPMVSVLEGVDPAESLGEPPISATSNGYDWSLLIQGFVADDPVHPTDPAYYLLADVRKRLAVERGRKAANSRSQPDPLGLGTGKNRIDAISLGSGIVRPPDDVSAKAWFWMTLTFSIVEDAIDPYA